MIALSEYVSGYSDYSEFIKLCNYSQSDLYKSLCTRLKLMKYNVYTNEQDGSKYIYATHTSEPVNVTLVAHLDTMFAGDVRKNVICDKNIITSPQGLGADDRAGVYGILEIIKKYKCNVLFVCDEEYGQRGSKNFVRSPYFEEFKKNNNFLISLDLSGKERMKFYDTTNKEFIDTIKKITNFKVEESGTHIADLSILVKGYESDTTGAKFDGCGLAGVNLCCGYENEHKLDEYIDMNVLESTVLFVMEIIKQIGNKRYKFI